jgi:hypothetical protein
VFGAGGADAVLVRVVLMQCLVQVVLMQCLVRVVLMQCLGAQTWELL